MERERKMERERGNDDEVQYNTTNGERERKERETVQWFNLTSAPFTTTLYTLCYNTHRHKHTLTPWGRRPWRFLQRPPYTKPYVIMYYNTYKYSYFIYYNTLGTAALAVGRYSSSAPHSQNILTLYIIHIMTLKI
jgi:hypothetical protein